MYGVIGRVRGRFLISVAVALTWLAVIPAASRAAIIFHFPPTGGGIAAAGTVTGDLYDQNGDLLWSGPVQFAGVEECDSVPSHFVAQWTDPGGKETFKLIPGVYTSTCSVYTTDYFPQAISFGGGGVTGPLPGDTGQLDPSSSGYFGPGYQNLECGSFSFGPCPQQPATVEFTIDLNDGDSLKIADQAPGPLQGAPGRVQPMVGQAGVTT